jgi:succinoglycan biosynthesis protein ExoA
VLAQDYPGPVQVVLAVADSQDATAQVAADLAARDPRVVLVPNPEGSTPAALAVALAAARHPVVARVDAHGAVPADYLRIAVQTLRRTGAANVGGVAVAVGDTPTQRAIAAAMRSPWGMGGARFRVGGVEGPAETVFPGVYDRSWIERVGGFDPSCARAPDWELNLRIRQAGGTVWFTPLLRIEYRPRRRLRDLARQFYATGQWRRHLSGEHRGALGPRYLAPPTVLVAVLVGLVGGPVWHPLWLLPAGYAVTVCLGGAWAGRGERPGVVLRMPAVLATMHLAWGAGFLRGTGVSPRSAAPAPGSARRGQPATAPRSSPPPRPR